MKYKVSSGDYEIIVEENSAREAANKAIRLHSEQKENTKLGSFTLVEQEDKQGEPAFIDTVQLIKANTSGFGDEDGQYSRVKK